VKVGILTFHRANNYGAVLQAYALQQHLLSQDIDCDIIDYRSSAMEEQYRVKSLFERRGFKDIIRWALNSSSEKRIVAVFEKFRKTHLVVSTKKYESSKDLKEGERFYDRIICGSDQVWSYKALGFDKNYLLDFTDDRSKKYSYAASFGVESIPLEFIPEYKRCLSGFSSLSVREARGVDLVKEITGFDAELHLDPVFLLGREDWVNQMKCKRLKKKYIFVYAFELTASMKLFIERLTVRTSCDVLVLTRTYRKILNVPYSCVSGLTPPEFVETINNAEYVVTNSFHGTAFSILLNKLFFTEMLFESSHVNSRLTNILDLFSLTERKIGTVEISKMLDDGIDWNFVNSIIFTQREKSGSYLRRITQPRSEGSI